MGKTATLANIGSVADSSLGFRNRIINGAMVIDQRNAGASVTPGTGTYTVDRWRIYASQSSKLTAQQNAGSVTLPAGYTNYLGMTSSSAYSIISSDLFVLQQFVEGYNSSDLAWGTASAKAVTLSFWVRSSLTGVFGVNVQSGDGLSCYSTTYTINAANTWEQKTITVAGPTSGTWLTTNGKGIVLNFIIGVGSASNPPANNVWQSANYYGAVGAQSLLATNGATLYITGVQLEKGATATSFDYRDYGRELILCQRYYAKQLSIATFTNFGVGTGLSTTNASMWLKFNVTMRSAPTISVASMGLSDGQNLYAITSLSTGYIGTDSALLQPVVTTGLTQFRPYQLQANNSASAFVDYSSEL